MSIDLNIITTMILDFLKNKAWQWIIAVAFIVYIIFYIKVVFIEHKIKKIHRDIEDKIIAIKSQPIILARQEGEIKAYKEKRRPELEKLERKRKYIIDKLLFLRR